MKESCRLGKVLAQGCGGAKDLLVLSLHGELLSPLQVPSGFSWQYQKCVFMCRLWLSLHLNSPY